MLLKLRENGAADLLVALILGFSLFSTTGRPPNILPKPFEFGFTYILALSEISRKAKEVRDGALPSKIILLRLSQLRKAQFPMLATLSGIVTLVKALQFLKAFSPMVVRPFLILTFFRFMQSRNAQSAMVVTLSGIVTLVRPLQLLKACFPMLVIGLPS